ncbi:proteasome accessory factor PafA2 family protein [Paractinoplanes durhamensis]
MSVRRIMGTEVEYGISVPGQPGANPMVTSSQVVNAYGARPELNRGGAHAGITRRSRRFATLADSPTRAPPTTRPTRSPTRTWAWPTSY